MKQKICITYPLKLVTVDLAGVCLWRCLICLLIQKSVFYNQIIYLFIFNN